MRLPTPRLINLTIDPQERETASFPHLHTWVATHMTKIITEFETSLHHEPLIPVGATLDHIPRM